MVRKVGDKERRVNPRRACRGRVLVSELSSGRRSEGALIDVSQGGIRLALAHGLADDEVVQLVFPRKNNDNRPEGRTIIGHVVHSKPEVGRHVVRIAFGWDANVGAASKPIRKDPKSASFLRPISRGCEHSSGQPGTAGDVRKVGKTFS